MSSLSAVAPNTLLKATQPMANAQLTTPGSTIDLPNAARDSGIWPMPVRGPQVHRAATTRAPVMLPVTIAGSPGQKLSPRLAASTPMNNADGVNCGDSHIVKIRNGRP